LKLEDEYNTFKCFEVGGGRKVAVRLFAWARRTKVVQPPETISIVEDEEGIQKANYRF
jgi:hypothetical protein